MAVAVFDADVLIGFLNRSDAHHQRAVERVSATLVPGMRRLICAVNYTEVLFGPLRVGAQETVEAMVVRLNIEIVTVDLALAQRAAAVRERTGLKLPDAYALATAIHAEARGWAPVTIESFDAKVQAAHAALRPAL